MKFVQLAALTLATLLVGAGSASAQMHRHCVQQSNHGTTLSPDCTQTSPQTSVGSAPVANVPAQFSSWLESEPTESHTNAVYLYGDLIGYCEPTAGNIRLLLGVENYEGQQTSLEEQQQGIWWKHFGF